MNNIEQGYLCNLYMLRAEGEEGDEEHRAEVTL